MRRAVRRARAGSLAVGLAVAAALAPGCSRSKGERGATVTPLRGKAAAVYAARCQGCHGTDGRMGPATPLNDPLYLAIASDDMLHRVIAEGRPGARMPAFSRGHGGSLGDRQIDDLIEAMRERWGQPVSDPRVIAMRRYLEAIDRGADRPRGDPVSGRATFELACASCHGDHGQGAADEAGPLDDPSYLALITDDLLRRITITGRADLEMPSFLSGEGRPERYRPLAPEDVADVVAFIDTWRAPRRAPAPRQKEEMAQ